ncbi:MAG: hypothetical protein EPN23_08470 [Verrucomicrobia bacterium]|nr:MAG: hypothetical protein EPN23_08470 [Verrucomicrobiota bacterium]
MKKVAKNTGNATRVDGTSKNVRLRVNLPQAMRKWVKKSAAHQGVSPDDFMNNILKIEKAKKNTHTLMVALNEYQLGLLKVAMVKEAYAGSVEQYAAQELNDNVRATLNDEPSVDLNELAKIGMRIQFA